jgi:hypothetical protein
MAFRTRPSEDHPPQARSLAISPGDEKPGDEKKEKREQK